MLVGGRAEAPSDPLLRHDGDRPVRVQQNTLGDGAEHYLRSGVALANADDDLVDLELLGGREDVSVRIVSSHVLVRPDRRRVAEGVLDDVQRVDPIANRLRRGVVAAALGVDRDDGVVWMKTGFQVRTERLAVGG